MKIIILAFIIYKILSFVWIYIRPSAIKKYLREDAYAFITGSTDGIGKAVAMELAAKGFNIILHGRNTDKLDMVKQEITNRYGGVKVIGILYDGSEPGYIDLTPIQSLKITVLINNAGVGPISAFGQLSPAEIDATINLNTRFPTQLTHQLLPQLSQPALIMNVSSYAGLYPPPYLAVYAATKAYNNAFSKSLAVELENIESISLITGSVHTASNQQPVTFMRPDSSKYARHVLQVAGCGRKSVFPYWPHALQTYLLALLPEQLISKMMKKVISNPRQDSGTA